MSALPARAFDVEVVRDPERLKAIVPEWDALAQASVEPNVFYESWMLLAALEAFGINADISIVLLWLGGAAGMKRELVALFPLQRAARFKYSPLPAWKLWKYAHCYLCTPLVRSDGLDTSLEEIFRWMRSSRGPQLIDFGHIAGEGPFRDALAAASWRHKLPTLVSDHHRRAMLCVAADTAAHLENAGSAQTRRAMRRRERRLVEMGLERRSRFDDEDAVRRWTDEFLALEKGGWKGQAGTALACSPANERFFRDIVLAAHRRGQLLALALDAAGRPIARRCTFTAGDGAFAFKTAYDEEFARFSPGVLLERDAIAQSLATPGLRWVDSCTTPDNEMLNRLWNGSRAIESVALGAGPWEKLLIATFPMLRRVRDLLPEKNT